MKNLLLIAALSTAAASAQAWEPEVYAGANASFWIYDHDETPSNFSVASGEALAGLNLLKYLAVEVRAGLGVNEGRDSYTEVDVNGTETTNEGEVELKSYASLYFKPMISNEKASLYGLIGYSMVDMSYVQDGNTIFDDSDDDISLGFGVSFAMTPNTEVTAEWKKLINADTFDYRGGSVGFIYKF